MSDDELTDTTSQRNAGDAAYVWLGGSDQKKEGDWRWLRSNDKIEKHPCHGGNWGTAQAYKGQREPDNFKGEQHHLALALEFGPVAFSQANEWDLPVNGDKSEKTNYILLLNIFLYLF